jgi:hypothetical protein
MAILNKRNAVVGWLVLKAGKKAAKRKAQDAVPGPRAGGIAAGVLAALGGLLFWRRKRGGSTSDASE